MTRDDIMRMARSAGPLISTPFDLWCERFATLVAAAEREACADICDDLHWSWRIGEDSGPKECAKTIRARGEKETE